MTATANTHDHAPPGLPLSLILLLVRYFIHPK